MLHASFVHNIKPWLKISSERGQRRWPVQCLVCVTGARNGAANSCFTRSDTIARAGEGDAPARCAAPQGRLGRV